MHDGLDLHRQSRQHAFLENASPASHAHDLFTEHLELALECGDLEHRFDLIRSEAHRPALEALGADIVINTESLDLRDEVARVTGGRGVDYAMDCVGGDVAAQMLQCLTLGGHMVVFGTLGNTPITLPSRDMMMPATRLSGYFAGSWLALQPPARIPGILGKVGQLAAKGVFDTPVDAVYPLAQVHEALAASQDRGRLGKVMLRISH
jgi:NADPH:quinone reductase-like Zn-dependent oxidoreductase